MGTPAVARVCRLDPWLTLFGACTGSERQLADIAVFRERNLLAISTFRRSTNHFPELLLRSRMEIGRPYSRLLHRLERLDALSGHDRQLIAELPLTVANFSANEEIACHGEAHSRCTLVLGGFLYSHKRVNGSRRQITSFFVPGDIPDLHTLHLAPLDDGLSTLGPAVVAFMPHAAVRAMLDRSPRLSKAFWRDTFIRLAILREWVTNLGRRDSISRVAHVICELAVRLQGVDLAQNLCFSIPWTQTDLADACGISNVHANRVVQELRRLGLVEWDSRKIRIRDWDAIAKIGDFSDEYLQLGRPLKREPLLGPRITEHV
jgi:CRP-like cAMP-binding protein